MAKILVVDDFDEMRKALQDILTRDGHSVVAAENGKVARGLFGIAQFDLVISDIQMPHFDGVELLKWIKERATTPVILITGFSHILETEAAFKLGASDFLTKPFRHSEVLDAVRKLVVKEEAPKEEPDLDHQFCSIPIQEFVSSEDTRVNIFVRLSRRKYIRVAHKGDQLPTDRLETYRDRGVTFLYARKEDFASLVDFNLGVARMVKGNERMSAEKRLGFLRYTTETVLENIVVNGIDKKKYGQAKECVQSCLNLVTESDDVVQLLDILNSHANWLYAHSLGVSVYSVMIGRELGWHSTPILFKLSAAGLFHDIGAKEIEHDILDKYRPMLTLEERKLYETHPSRGKEILETLKEMPGEVVTIAYQHHEDMLGTGYPRQLGKLRIHPLARVISVADAFCYQAIKNPHSAGSGAREALVKIAMSGGNSLDTEAIDALRACLDH
ncbi:MAG: response regulator [Bdellovibrionota bacterium]